MSAQNTVTEPRMRKLLKLMTRWPAGPGGRLEAFACGWCVDSQVRGTKGGLEVSKHDISKPTMDVAQKWPRPVLATEGRAALRHTTKEGWVRNKKGLSNSLILWNEDFFFFFFSFVNCKKILYWECSRHYVAIAIYICLYIIYFKVRTIVTLRKW